MPPRPPKCASLGPTPSCADLISSLDKNGDGIVSKEECKKCKPSHECDDFFQGFNSFDQARCEEESEDMAAGMGPEAANPDASGGTTAEAVPPEEATS